MNEFAVIVGLMNDRYFVIHICYIGIYIYTYIYLDLFYFLGVCDRVYCAYSYRRSHKWHRNAKGSSFSLWIDYSSVYIFYLNELIILSNFSLYGLAYGQRNESSSSYIQSIKGNVCVCVTCKLSGIGLVKTMIYCYFI